MRILSGKFVWFEYGTTDLARAKEFYTAAFGWKLQPFPLGDTSYDMLLAGETPVGGIHQPSNPGQLGWASLVSVASVDDAIERATNAGGSVVEPAVSVPEVGRMAKLADPEGATFWVMRGNGDDAADTPSVPGSFHWNELSARDPKRAAAFYAEVIGYRVDEMPMPDGTYRVLQADGVPRAGITALQGDGKPGWLPYVAVADCDRTLARCRELGARELVPPMDVPEVGRFAMIVDPFGQTLAFMKPAENA